MRQLLRVVVVVGTLALTACGSDEGGPTAGEEPNPAPTAKPATTTTVDETSVDRDEVVRGYIDAFATSNPEKMAVMHDFAEPGSVADVYATHQIAFNAALRDDGEPLTAQRVTYQGDEAEVCSVEGETCGVWANFTTDPESGLLTGFTVNDQSLEGRILGGNGKSMSAGGAQFTLVSAYKSIQSETTLWVVVEVANGPEPISIYPWEAEYVTADGRQVGAVGGLGPADLRANVKATHVLGFDGADLGGTVYVAGAAGQNQSEPFEVELPLK